MNHIRWVLVLSSSALQTGNCAPFSLQVHLRHSVPFSDLDKRLQHFVGLPVLISYILPSQFWFSRCREVSSCIVRQFPLQRFFGIIRILKGNGFPVLIAWTLGMKLESSDSVARYSLHTCFSYGRHFYPIVFDLLLSQILARTSVKVLPFFDLLSRTGGVLIFAFYFVPCRLPK